MTTQEIANRLVALCRIGKFDEAYEELFSANAMSIEPAYTQQPDVIGLDMLLEKSAQFASDIKEFHASSVSDPVVAGNHFSCNLMIDFTKQNGERMKMEEICVYEVQDGKIIKEQFFY